MEERLQVRIEADIKDFQQGMNKVEQNLKRAEGIFSSSSKRAFQLENAIAQLSKEYKSGSISSGQYSSNLDKLNAELSQQRSNVSASAKEVDRLNKLMSANQLQKVASANQNVSQSFKGLSTNVRGSNTVALEFNRIIQDAPFGMMGIGNNLQQLAGNFSNLSKQAGGSVPAIKAAFSAMISGPNLALLAISALTAGITAYNMGAFDFLKSNKEAKKSLEDLKEESEEYVKNLNAIARAQVQGTQSAQGQLTSLKLLYDRTQDVTLSEEERVKAVRELQKVYPQVFGNLNQEIILNGQAKKSYDELASSILATAKARAAEETLVENQKQLIALNKERANVLDEIAKKQQEVSEADEKFLKSPGSNVPQYLTGDQQVSNTAQEKANELKERQVAIEAQIKELNADNLGLTSEITKEQSNIVAEVEKIPKALRDAIDHAGDLNLKELFEISEFMGVDDKEVDKAFNDMIKSFSDKIEEQKAKPLLEIPIKGELLFDEVGADNDEIVERFHKQKEAIEGVFSDLGRSMQNTLAGAFEGALLNGDNFFQSVIDGFKKMLAQLAAQLAASAVIKVLGMIIGGPAGAAIGMGGSGGIGSLLGGVLGGSGMRIGQTPSLGVPTTGTSSAGYKVDVNVQGVLRGNDIHVAAQRNNRDFNRYY